MEFNSTIRNKGRRRTLTARTSTLLSSSSSRGSVNSVIRAFRILESVVFANGPVSLAEISQRVQLPASTTHRLLRTLMRAGYIAQEEHTERYVATLKLFNLGSMVLSRFSLAERLLPMMRRLAEEIGESVSLVVLEGMEGVLLERVAGSRGMQVFSKYRRVPLYCTAAGKAILSGFDEQRLEHYLARTPLERHTENTICTAARLKDELAKIRASGFAVDNEEIEKGARCVAVPVTFVDGTPAAISVSALAPRMDEKTIQEIARRLKKHLNSLGVTLSS